MIDTIPEVPQVSGIIEDALSDVLGDKKSPQQALDWAAVGLHRELGGKCPSNIRFLQH